MAKAEFKSYKESYEAGRMSAIIETQKNFNDGWEDFKKSETFKDLIKNLERAGIKHPYNENILWWAFDAGFKLK